MNEKNLFDLWNDKNFQKKYKKKCTDMQMQNMIQQMRKKSFVQVL